jgi:cytochrome c oxidase assembly protein subunit 15
VPHQAQGQLHAWIEFGNRLIAWLIFIAAVLALIGIVKHLKSRNDYRQLRTLAIYQLLGFVAQAVLGGITVLTKLNPITVSAHFLLSIPLVSGAISLRNRYLYKDHFQVSQTTKLAKNSFLIGTVMLLVIGTVVTGSGPLSGDVAAKRYRLDAAKVAALHSYVAIIVLISLIALLLAIRFYESTEVQMGIRNLIYGAFAILLVQGAVGYRQFALGLPEILVGMHLLGATLTWIFTWNIHLRMRNR